jgi:hypothetical protein
VPQHETPKGSAILWFLGWFVAGLCTKELAQEERWSAIRLCRDFRRELWRFVVWVQYTSCEHVSSNFPFAGVAIIALAGATVMGQLMPGLTGRSYPLAGCLTLLGLCLVFSNLLCYSLDSLITTGYLGSRHVCQPEDIAELRQDSYRLATWIQYMRCTKIKRQ